MYKPVIGLEIHIQSKTKSKMFCSCSSEYFGKEPNVNVCPVCSGMPGALPVINSKAIDNCLKLSLALNCEINNVTKFDRKNYFYPDLPKGYQISQYDLPIGKNGYLGIEINGDEERIRIRRVHQEEDTAKSLHAIDVDENGSNTYTMIDLNKSGVALIEVVTEPDFTNTLEVNEFAKSLQRIVRYLNVSDADMEKGQMRFELNISLRKEGETQLPNYKVEVKNISSISILEKVINFEIKRQEEMLTKGEVPIQETRGIEDKTGETFSQRFKEDAQDYRYFPEPDLPKLEISDGKIDEIRSEIGELPLDKKNRFVKEYGIENDVARQIVNEKDKAEWFEIGAKLLKERKTDPQSIVILSNFLVGEIESVCKKKDFKINTMKLTPQNMCIAITLMMENKISGGVVKRIIEEGIDKDLNVEEYIERNGLIQINDKADLENIIKETINENPDILESYKKGKLSAKSALIGQVMKKSKGKANPKETDKLLTEILSKMKILILALIFIVLLFNNPSFINDASAQTSSSESSASSTIEEEKNKYQQDQVIKIEMEKLTQSAYDKTLPVKLVINSKIDTDRLEVTWNYDKDKLKLLDDDTKYYSIKSNEPLELKYTFKALVMGDNRVFVKVQAWQNEANYPEVKSIDLNFDENLEIIPQTQQYYSSLNTINSTKLVLGIIAAIIVLFLLFKGIRKFLIWYEKD